MSAQRLWARPQSRLYCAWAHSVLCEAVTCVSGAWFCEEACTWQEVPVDAYRMYRVKGSALRRGRKLYGKNVVIVIIEDIITNIALMAAGHLMNVIVRFVIGLDCREACRKLRRFVQGILSSRWEVNSKKALCRPKGAQSKDSPAYVRESEDLVAEERRILQF